MCLIQPVINRSSNTLWLSAPHQDNIAININDDDDNDDGSIRAKMCASRVCADKYVGIVIMMTAMLMMMMALFDVVSKESTVAMKLLSGFLDFSM